jgi:hypothetical protein
MNRRSFLKSLGIGAAAAAVPMTGFGRQLVTTRIVLADRIDDAKWPDWNVQPGWNTEEVLGLRPGEVVLDARPLCRPKAFKDTLMIHNDAGRYLKLVRKPGFNKNFIRMNGVRVPVTDSIEEHQLNIQTRGFSCLKPKL